MIKLRNAIVGNAMKEGGRMMATWRCAVSEEYKQALSKICDWILRNVLRAPVMLLAMLSFFSQLSSAVVPDPGCSFTIYATTSSLVNYQLKAPMLGNCDPTFSGIFTAVPSEAHVMPISTTFGAQLTINDSSGYYTANNAYLFTYQPTAMTGTDTATFYAYNAALTNYQQNTVTINVVAPVSYSPASPPAGQVGSAYNQSLASATGGTGSKTYSLTSGSLPAGITLASNGTLSGTPTAGGSFNFTVTATDSSGAPGPFTATSSTLTLVIASLVYTPASPAAAAVGTAYSQSVATPISGGTSPYTYALASGSLPAGISLASNGTLSGTPTAGGTFNFTVKATDSASANVTSGSLTLSVAAPTIIYAPANPAGATVGAAYSQSMAGASGGTAPYTYAVTAGSLPAGMSLTSNGTLAGTPTAGGTFNFTVTATDSSTGTGPYSQSSASRTLTVAAPTVAYAPSNPAGGTVAAAYSQSLAGASGGTAPYTYAVTAGSLPAGLSLASSGTLSGTPTAGGTFNFTVTATDSSTGTGPYSHSSSSLSLNIAGPTISYAPSSPAAGNAGVAYNQSLSGASGGSAPYTYALTSGSLPAGLSLASNGTLSGTPTAAGNFSFVVTATDSSTGTGPYTHSSSALSLAIGSPTLSLSPASLTAASVGNTTNQTITASGGTSTYTYAVTAGSLPAGLTLSSGGVLSGTPTGGGTFNFTVTATDSTTGTGSPFTGSRAYTLTVNVPTISVSPALLSAVSAGTTVSGSITASGGTNTYSYAVTAGSLPPGVSLSAAGVLSGKATAVGTYNFTVTATDSSTGTGPYSGSRVYAWTVNAPTLTISPVSGSNLSGSALTAYSQAFAVSGGNGPYTYGIVINSGSLPSGLSFSTSTGVLSGTPTTSGTANFTVTATDASTGAGSPFSVSGTYTLTIGVPTVVVAPAGSISNPVIGTAYSQSFTASGANAPYSYVVSSGVLPAGLTLSAGGVLSGNPTQTGTFSFTIQATDTNSFSGTRAYSVTVAAPTLTLTPASLPNGNPSVSYNQTISASGGSAPYSFAVTAGTLPTGLTLNPTTGAITGTPTVLNTFNFTVTATDSTTGTGAPFTTANSYSVVINMLPPVAGAKTANTLSNTPVQIDLAPVITGGVPASAAIVAAPAHGNAVMSGFQVTYTPTAGFVGTDSFTYTATNASGTSATATVTVTVASSLSPPIAGTVNLTFAANSKANPVTPNLSGGITTSLAVVSTPAHGTVAINGTNMSYTPAEGYFGADSFTYTASNAAGTSAPATVSITIPQPLPVARSLDKSVTLNSSNNIQLPIDGVVESIIIVTPPLHGTLTISSMGKGATQANAAPSAIVGPTVLYIPQQGYIGPDSFAYIARNAAGSSEVATVSLQVTPPPPVLGAVNGVVLPGKSIAMDVTAQATGGPFTGLRIVTQPVVGSVVVEGNNIIYSAPADYSGKVSKISIGYELSNVYGTSQGLATVTIDGRPDPSKDAEVNGLLNAQAESSRRFADAQVKNFSRRMESLHTDGWGGAQFGLSLGPISLNGISRKAANTKDVNSEAAPVSKCLDKSSEQSIHTKKPLSQATCDDNLPSLTDDRNDLGFWSGGGVDFGQRNAANGQEGHGFRTDGISMGADYRVSSWLSLGIGAGYGRDVSDVGNNGSKSKASNSVIALYGTLRPAEKFFIDALMGYSQLNFDLKRYQADINSFATGTRDGRQLFGAIIGGYELRGENWALSSYGRLDSMSTSLDAYSENAAENALYFEKQTLRTNSATLGASLQGRIEFSSSSLQPHVRLEFRHHFEGSDSANLRYADLGISGVLYRTNLIRAERNQAMIEIGAKLCLKNDLSLTIDYDASLDNSSGYSHSIRSGLEFLF
ncbi:putative Ig domain-containing protein [Chitinibacter fontanus]|uniref:Putative Ig domain-containing protein n=1 Tax=Chitinibacter fontanus TaxID=1737446 RepID=A0A7D5VC60_9NEIS|nr:putative Ig domain-containing protein [Chitinibacter fontanus]QLI82673.1 putative Ig domain-containing protein [Chitinibacter fontanus]